MKWLPRMPQKLLVANLFEYTLVGVGWLLLWRLQLNPRTKVLRESLGLAYWRISGAGFGGATLCVTGGWLLGQILAGILAAQFPGLKTDQTLWVIGGGITAQLCFIGGALGGIVFLRKTEPLAIDPNPPMKQKGLFSAALITCVITISIVHPVQYVWGQLLTALHFPADKQEMVEIFRQTDSPLRLFWLTFMAVILAPIGEELVFRAGLFRFLRGRLPRWIALTLPSLIFAVIHQTWSTVAPLAALGIIFSIAYERTGRIGVPILAHALFNLHTVVFLLLGIAE